MFVFIFPDLGCGLVDPSYLDILLLSQVGHTKGYIQVLVIAPESFLGISTDVKITSVGRWSVFGEVIGKPEALIEDASQMNSLAKVSPSPNSCSDCACSRDEPESCSLTSQNCGQNYCMGNEASIIVDSLKPGNWSGRILANSISSLLLRKRMQGSEKKSDEHEMQNMEERRNTSRCTTLDWILVGGMFASFIVMVMLLILIYCS